jgi:acyl-CoA synthetase (AMP-forming)/AMP-acid ligase II
VEDRPALPNHSSAPLPLRDLPWTQRNLYRGVSIFREGDRADATGFKLRWRSRANEPAVRAKKAASKSRDFDAPNPFLKILCADMCGMSSDSIYLSPAPLYHAAPLRFNMMAITLGGTSIIMEHCDAEEFLKLVEKYKVTQSQLVPTMFVRMLKLPDEVRTRYDVSTLKGAIHAAAPCPVDVKAKMIEWWGPILIEYYAGSEGNGVTVSTSQQWLTHRGTVGRAVVGKVKILDENDEERPVGEIGTVYFADGRPFQYHNDPKKTAESRNAKGWTTLGDVGWLRARTGDRVERKPQPNSPYLDECRASKHARTDLTMRALHRSL